MEKELVFALISTVIYLIGAVPYWKDVLKGRTIPHLFTAGVGLIIVLIHFHVPSSNRHWIGLIPSIPIFISLFFGVIYGVKMFKQIQINWFDYTCLASSLVLILYSISGHIFFLYGIISGIAFLPTLKKGWLQPWTESIFLYFMISVGYIFILFSSQGFPNVIGLLFVGISFFANLTFFFMVALRRYYLKGWKSIFE